MATTKDEVEQFLKELKFKITFNPIVFRPRDKNIQALADLDLIPREREDIIKNLKVEDYYTGPNNDTHDPSRPHYYEFGVSLKGVDVYIKISKGLENKSVDCMSFHIAEREIVYPFKQEKK